MDNPAVRKLARKFGLSEAAAAAFVAAGLDTPVKLRAHQAEQKRQDEAFQPPAIQAEPAPVKYTKKGHK